MICESDYPVETMCLMTFSVIIIIRSDKFILP